MLHDLHRSATQLCISLGLIKYEILIPNKEKVGGGRNFKAPMLEEPQQPEPRNCKAKSCNNAMENTHKNYHSI